MSEWALAFGVEHPLTAFEFRELFLTEGVVFENFECPECGAKYIPVLVYSENEELAKSPHFRAANGHIDKNCPQSSPAKRKDVKRLHRHFEKQNFRLPEELVRYKKRVNKLKAIIQSRSHRRYVGEPLGPAKYRTAFVRVIAEAWTMLIKESYKIKRKNNLTEEERNQLVNDVLKQSPINLMGFETNYKTAIRDTYFPPPIYPRIYHGYATVDKDSERFVLKFEKMVKEEDGHFRNCFIDIEINSSEEGILKWQKATIQNLQTAFSKNLRIKCFAYGNMILDGDSYHLKVADMSYFHCYIGVQK